MSDDDRELMEAARKMEEEHAPDCSDCGVRMDLRGVQRNGNDTGWLVQWKCPECDPERVKIDKGLPDGYEVVPLEPEDSEQMTLAQAATDGGVDRESVMPWEEYVDLGEDEHPPDDRLPHCPDCERPLNPDLSCPECPYWWSWANWDGHLPEWVR